MAKLREKLDSHHRTSEQLSAEQTREDDEREQQLLTLMMSAMKLQLELRQTKDKKNQDKMNLEGAKKTIEKYETVLELSKQITDTKEQSSSEEKVYGIQMTNVEDETLPLTCSDTPPTQEDKAEPLKKVVALYSFTGRSDQELSFKDGDVLHVTEKKSPDWWYGMNSDGRQGFIPVNYVQIQEFSNPSEDLTPQDNVRAKDELVRQKEDQLATAPLQKQQSGEKTVQTTEGAITTSLMYAIAVKDRVALDIDELSIRVGDVIEILDKTSTDDLWWHGSVGENTGCFPASCVRLASDTEKKSYTEKKKFSDRTADTSHKDSHNSSGESDTVVKELSLQATPLVEPKLPLKFKWRHGRHMPFGMRGGPNIVVMNGDVYFGGGSASSDDDEKTVCVYTPGSDSWSRLPPYKYSCFGLTVTNENQLLAVGGLSEDTPTNKIGVWDDKLRRWVFTIPPMNAACSSPAVATYNQWLLVAGGITKVGSSNFIIDSEPNCCLSRVEVMNLSSKQWYQVSSLPVTGYRMSSTVIGNTWYLMGGFTDNGSKSVISICVEHIISANSSTWNSLPDIPLPFATALAFHGALLAVGGLASSSKIYLYQPSKSKWIKIGDMPIGRDMSACTVLPNGHVMIAGGYGGRDRVDIAQVL